MFGSFRCVWSPKNRLQNGETLEAFWAGVGVGGDFTCLHYGCVWEDWRSGAEAGKITTRGTRKTPRFCLDSLAEHLLLSLMNSGFGEHLDCPPTYT